MAPVVAHCSTQSGGAVTAAALLPVEEALHDCDSADRCQAYLISNSSAAGALGLTICCRPKPSVWSPRVRIPSQQI